MKTRLVDRNTSSRRGTEPHASLKSGEGEKLEQSITINRAPSEIYSFWRQLENLSRFMQHIKSVTQTGDGISHWVVETTHGAPRSSAAASIDRGRAAADCRDVEQAAQTPPSLRPVTHLR